MIVDELIAILGFDLRGESDIARFNRGIDQAERNARQAASAFSAMGVAVGTFVGNIATQAFTRLGYTIGSLPGQVIETGKMFEALQIRLETLEGSSEKAERAMAWIRQFAKDTPLQLAEVADAYADLRNYGIDPTSGTLGIDRCHGRLGQRDRHARASDAGTRPSMGETKTPRAGNPTAY